MRTGFITAKVGRPDIYRSGAYILRLLHSSTIPWTFLPPSLSPSEQDHRDAEMDGIWLHSFKPRPGATNTGGGAGNEERDSGSDDDDRDGSAFEDDSQFETDDDDEDGDEDDSADEKAVKAVQGAFAALAVEGEDSDEEEDSEPDAAD